MFQGDLYRSIMRAADEAVAYRKDGMIEIFMIVQLPTPCDEIKRISKYPGDIFHIDDPGTAELFIEIGRKSGMENNICAEVIVPFFIGVEIYDSGLYNEVTIYINDYMYNTIKIKENGGQSESQYKKRKTTIQGKLEFRWVESPHTVLKSDNGKTFWLFGNIKEIDKLKCEYVEIIGVARPDMFTFDMDGIPFEVETIKELC